MMGKRCDGWNQVVYIVSSSCAKREDREMGRIEAGK